MSALRMNTAIALSSESSISGHCLDNIKSMTNVESKVWLTVRNFFPEGKDHARGYQEIDLWFYDIQALITFVGQAQKLLVDVVKTAHNNVTDTTEDTTHD